MARPAPALAPSLEGDGAPFASDGDRLVIDPGVAARLVARQFLQWADLPVTPLAEDGWDNQTFRLGRMLKLRLPRAARYAPQVAKEATWLPHLAPHLAVAIPEPVATGRPGLGYPFEWSVQRWLAGVPLAAAPPADMERLARDVAAFLQALQMAPIADGPPAGAHSFHRGGALAAYDGEVRATVRGLGARVDGAAALALWDAALAAPFAGPPVWVHGDVAPGNLLVDGGRLAGVIDFGSCAVGDPACDYAIAWTAFTGPGRAAFRAAVPADDATWARARGWALWKALLVLAAGAARPGEAPSAAVIAALLAKHREAGR